MLSTLHFCSNLGVKNDLKLFQLPPTQFSHEGFHYQDFHPLSPNYQPDSAVNFHILNTGENYLDPSAIFLHVRGNVTRENGDRLVPLPPKPPATAPTGDDVPDKVYPADNFINTLFETCDIFLNDVRINHHEMYTYRSYVDVLLESNIAMFRHTLWPLCFHPDTSEQKLDVNDSEGIVDRYRVIKESRDFDLISPIFTDIAQQGK